MEPNFNLSWLAGDSPRLICKSDNSFDSRITAIDWMNAHDESLIIIGTDDGSVRIWKPDLDTGKTRWVEIVIGAYQRCINMMNNLDMLSFLD